MPRNSNKKNNGGGGNGGGKSNGGGRNNNNNNNNNNNGGGRNSNGKNNNKGGNGRNSNGGGSNGKNSNKGGKGKNSNNGGNGRNGNGKKNGKEDQYSRYRDQAPRYMKLNTSYDQPPAAPPSHLPPLRHVHVEYYPAPKPQGRSAIAQIEAHPKSYLNPYIVNLFCECNRSVYPPTLLPQGRYRVPAKANWWIFIPMWGVTYDELDLLQCLLKKLKSGYGTVYLSKDWTIDPADRSCFIASGVWMEFLAPENEKNREALLLIPIQRIQDRVDQYIEKGYTTSRSETDTDIEMVDNFPKPLW